MLVSSLAVCRESMRALEAKVEKLQAAEAAYLSAGASYVERARARESARERELERQTDRQTEPKTEEAAYRSAGAVCKRERERARDRDRQA